MGGAFSNNLAVTISCVTPDAVIRYTLDGSEVTASSAIYTVPLRLATPAAVHARAYKDGMLDSYMAVMSYYWLNTVAPRTAF